MLPDQYIEATLATFAYREAAQYGGIDNMLAVCHVIRNRMNAGWYGGDWLLALSKAVDVSCNIPGPEPEPMNLRDVTMRRFLDRIHPVFDGSAPDVLTEGALYYGELNKPIREWFTRNITNNLEAHAHIATVGPVWFFL